MIAVQPLTEVLIPHLPPPLRREAGQVSSLERLLTEQLALARAPWPDLALAPEVFIPYWAERMNPQGLLEQLRNVHVADLYLACACAHGFTQAIRLLEQRYFAEIDEAVRRKSASTLTAEEVRQVVREKLFVSKQGRPGRIAEYLGRAELRFWLRVTIVRTVLTLTTRAPKEAPIEDRTVDLIPELSADPELQYIQSLYRAEFEESLAEAAAMLQGRERNLLRYSFVEDLSIDQIASIYDVHRSTAARWVIRARDLLVKHLRQSLRKRLQVDSRELDSIFRLVESRLDTAVGRTLGTQG